MADIIDALADRIVGQTGGLSDVANTIAESLKSTKVPMNMKEETAPVIEDMRNYSHDLRTYSSKTTGSLTAHKYVGRENLKHWMECVRQSLVKVEEEYTKFEERTSQISRSFGEL